MAWSSEEQTGQREGPWIPAPDPPAPPPTHLNIAGVHPTPPRPAHGTRDLARLENAHSSCGGGHRSSPGHLCQAGPAPPLRPCHQPLGRPPLGCGPLRHWKRVLLGVRGLRSCACRRQRLQVHRHPDTHSGLRVEGHTHAAGSQGSALACSRVRGTRSVLGMSRGTGRPAPCSCWE